MIKDSDAIIIGGNIFGLYAGTLLEKNGLEVTIIENDLYNSIFNIGPMFFHNFDDNIKRTLNEKSLGIYNELNKKKNGTFIWPIDLYDKLKKNFKFKTMNFLNVECFLKNGKEVIGVKTDKGVINSKIILVMDGIFAKNLLLLEGINIENEIIEYGNVIAELNERIRISKTGEKIISGDGNFAYFSAPWKNTRMEFLKTLFSEVRELAPGMENCMVKRVWKNRHDYFKDALPRIGNVFFENAYFMAGYSRYGISFGLELSRLLTQLVLGKPTDFDVSGISFI